MAFRTNAGRGSNGHGVALFSGSGSVTTPANQQPATPTISAGVPTSSGATLTGSAFSDPDVGDTHAASQWQVTDSADTGFASPVISTGDDAVNLTSYNASGLTAATPYIARVRYKDSAGNYSDWSASASFTTAAAAGVTVNTPTTNSVGANTTTLAVTHTVPSGAKYLDVRIAYRKNGSQVVSSLASDVGGALTLQQGAWEVAVAGVYHAVYTLANPAAGAHTITLTLDQQAARITMSAASISGATSLTSAQAKDDATNAAPSVTIASAAGQLVIASVAHYDATATLTSSETEIANSAGANDSLGCRQHVYSKAGAASTTVSGTLSGAQDWVALAVAYAP